MDELDINDLITGILQDISKQQLITISERIKYARKHGIISKDECDIVYEDLNSFFDILP